MSFINILMTPVVFISIGLFLTFVWINDVKHGKIKRCIKF